MREEAHSVDEIRENLTLTEKGKTQQSIENSVYVLQHDPVLKGAICRNELSCRIDINGKMPWKRRGLTITNTDVNNLRLYLEKNYGLIGEKVINAAVDIVANENSYHPIRNYLDSLQWDGTERIRYLLHRYLGAEVSNYTFEVTLHHLLGAVRRVYNPGCKYDQMLCLVGGQGAGKSTFFRFLAIRDEWFSDDLKRIDDDNVYRKLQGHWIIEMSEMTATAKAKSVEEIKSFITRQKETYKIPYETHPEDRMRQCVFCGTSNNLRFLPLDRSGNRRFIPVQIHPEDAECHILDNEKESRAYIIQVWAEVMEIFRSGDYTMEFSDEVESYLKEIQREFMPEDTSEGVIEAFLEDYREDYVCTKLLYVEALGHGDYDEVPFHISRQISEIMDQMNGWEIGKQHRFKKYGRQRSWVRKPSCQQALSTETENFVEIPEQMEIPFD